MAERTLGIGTYYHTVGVWTRTRIAARQTGVQIRPAATCSSLDGVYRPFDLALLGRARTLRPQRARNRDANRHKGGGHKRRERVGRKDSRRGGSYVRLSARIAAVLSSHKGASNRCCRSTDHTRLIDCWAGGTGAADKLNSSTPPPGVRHRRPGRPESGIALPSPPISPQTPARIARRRLALQDMPGHPKTAGRLAPQGSRHPGFFGALPGARAESGRRS